MGKRKSAVVVKKTSYKAKMESSFPCPFCNQETAVECKLDRSRQIGSATCRQCSAGYQTVINYLTEAIDVYGEWVDAIEAQEQKKRKLNETKGQDRKIKQEREEERFIDDGEDLPDLPFKKKKAVEVEEEEEVEEAVEDEASESEAEFTDSDLKDDEWEAIPRFKETSWSIELKSRYDCAKLIQQIGQRLKLPPVVIATAQVYMHRFYVRHTFTDSPMAEVAPACVFLAGKVEENPRRLKEIIHVHLAIRFQTDELPMPDEAGEEYQRIRGKLLVMEQRLLETLGFSSLLVGHAYPFLERIIRGTMVPAPDWLDDFVRACYQVANDAQRMPLCLRYSPEQIAEAIVVWEGRREEAKHPEVIKLLKISPHRDILKCLEDLYSARAKK